MKKSADNIEEVRAKLKEKEPDIPAQSPTAEQGEVFVSFFKGKILKLNENHFEVQSKERS